MTIAEDVRRIVLAQDITSFALRSGYAVKKSGERIEFPQWIPMGTPKVEDGIIVHAEGQYADGSLLIYKWTPTRGKSVQVGKAKA